MWKHESKHYFTVHTSKYSKLRGRKIISNQQPMYAKFLYNFIVQQAARTNACTSGHMTKTAVTPIDSPYSTLHADFKCCSMMAVTPIYSPYSKCPHYKQTSSAAL